MFRQLAFLCESGDGDLKGQRGNRFDGLMGLAQSKLSNQGVLTPIEELAKTGLVQNAQMGYHLASVSDAVQDSEITFGGVE